MQKINLFFILAFEDQTNIYNNLVKSYCLDLNNGKKSMVSTLALHYILLSKYFNLYNFYEYEDKILDFDNAIIYHLPHGKDNINTGVEELLLHYKGKIPIVMRSYDAHSPLKLSSFYLDQYHDLALIYLDSLVNNKNRLFTQISYDNFLVTEYNIKQKEKFACIILRKETRKEYFEDSDDFKEIDIKKTYNLREKFSKYPQIDVYGSNWPYNMQNYKGPLIYSKKHYIQSLYKFNLILENAIVDNYLSEKILDTFVSLSVPVYLGTPVIEKYIPKECFIDIRDFKDYDELIKYLENMDENTYNEYIENILKYRNKIFNKFSTKNNFAIPVYKWYQENYNKDLEWSENFFDKEEEKIKNLKYINKIPLRDRLSDIKQKLKLFWYKNIVK